MTVQEEQMVVREKEIERQTKEFVKQFDSKYDAFEAVRYNQEYAREIRDQLLRDPEIQKRNHEKYMHSNKLDRLLSDRLECVETARKIMKVPVSQRKKRFEELTKFRDKEFATKLSTELRKQRQRQQEMER